MLYLYILVCEIEQESKQKRKKIAFVIYFVQFQFLYVILKSEYTIGEHRNKLYPAKDELIQADL